MSDDQRLKKRPEDVVRDGQYKATFWRNRGEDQDRIRTQLAKTYTDKEGNIRDTQSFSSRDLLHIQYLSGVAYEHSRELEYKITQEQRALQSQNTQTQEQQPQNQQPVQQSQPEYQPPAPAQNEHSQRQQYQEMRTTQQEQQPVQTQTQTPRQG